MEVKETPAADLTTGECEIILTALGLYQIRLYDELSQNKEESKRTEIDLVTSTIKKIHRRLEDTRK